MFEQLDTFWGGVVSLAGGSLVLFSFFKLAVSRPRQIAYDFRSSRINLAKLPHGFKVHFSFDDKTFPSIHKTEVLIKNETDAPLFDGSFLSTPTIHTGNSTICVARKVNGIDDSRASVKIAEGGGLQITDLMVPIDSSVTIEIVSVTPVDQTLHCVHTEFKTIKRNYGWWPRSREFLIVGPIISIMPTLIFYSLARFILGKEYTDAYFASISDGFRSLRFPEFLSEIIAGFHVSLMVFVVAYIYQLRLRASAAEKRFTKLKI